MTDPRTPCIVGVAKQTWHPGGEDTPEPLDLWATVSQAAADDSGGADVLQAVDSLGVIYSLSWQYDDPPVRLAERLGLHDGSRHYSGLSGTSPQKFVQGAATEILAGRSDAALLVGGESLYTKKQLKKRGEKPAWSFRPDRRPDMPFDDPFHPSEVAHQVFQAYLTFAVFDVARRAHVGQAPDAYRRGLGELMAPLSTVAAANPDAWLRTARSAAELVEATADNRMVAYPYTKYIISVMDLDMAAAVLVMSHEKADALGVSADRRVYLRGWCGGRDPVYVAERSDLWRSAAMEQASRRALESAGLDIDEIAHLDLYSCFGSSLHFSRDALGLADDDSRSLTVTGGLPFHGGPGNNYMTHALATLAQKLRAEPEAAGLVSGVGMHMTNHVFGIYSATPGEIRVPDEAAVQAVIDAEPRCAIRDSATGPATVAAYSVVHGRSGPAWGVVVCDLPDASRCYAQVQDGGLMGEMQEQEWVGRSVELVDGGGGVNVVKA